MRGAYGVIGVWSRGNSAGLQRGPRDLRVVPHTVGVGRVHVEVGDGCKLGDVRLVLDGIICVT
jgi:hypothetical protein